MAHWAARTSRIPLSQPSMLCDLRCNWKSPALGPKSWHHPPALPLTDRVILGRCLFPATCRAGGIPGSACQCSWGGEAEGPHRGCSPPPSPPSALPGCHLPPPSPPRAWVLASSSQFLAMVGGCCLGELKASTLWLGRCGLFFFEWIFKRSNKKPFASG